MSSYHVTGFHFLGNILLTLDAARNGFSTIPQREKGIFFENGEMGKPVHSPVPWVNLECYLSCGDKAGVCRLIVGVRMLPLEEPAININAIIGYINHV